MASWQCQYYYYLPIITTLLLILTSASYSSSVFSGREVPPHSVPLVRPPCPLHEMSALLHFRHSFHQNCETLNSVSTDPQVKPWPNNGHDCCTWDGVKCDEETGHVIGVDLSESCLYGNFPSNSSLFSLTHLQELHLAYNNFNHSPIPSALGHLTDLRSLDLSYSEFGGQIPFEISKLSKLSVLNLTANERMRFNHLSLEKLWRNLTRLTHLELAALDLSSLKPTILTNLTSLKHLDLFGANLHGQFPLIIFGLPDLESLFLGGNSALEGVLPEFKSNSRLREIDVSDTAFYGEVPPSIGRLAHLESLYLDDCSFSGSIPSSLGNLTRLTDLHLSDNDFHGGIPSSIANLTQLDWLTLGNNHLKGPIPQEISQLVNLSQVDFSGNENLYGKFEPFLKLKFLVDLELDNVNMTFDDSSANNESHPKLNVLFLHSCNLNEFPRFLANQDELQQLDLSHNRIHGTIPQWFANISRMWLTYLDLSQNFLVGFERPVELLPWSHLEAFHQAYFPYHRVL